MQSLWFNNYFPVSKTMVILLPRREYASVLCVLFNLMQLFYYYSAVFWW